MRVESPLVPQSLIESPKPIENKDVKSSGSNNLELVEEELFSIPSPFSSSGTYSPSSLRAAVDYHAKFLTVAGNNVEAAKHAATIPRAIIERFSVR